MKVSATIDKVAFKPITVQFTIESKEEFEAIYQLGNHNSFILKEINQVVKVDEEVLKNFLLSIWKKLDTIHPDGFIK